MCGIQGSDKPGTKINLLLFIKAEYLLTISPNCLNSFFNISMFSEPCDSDMKLPMNTKAMGGEACSPLKSTSNFSKN